MAGKRAEPNKLYGHTKDFFAAIQAGEEHDYTGWSQKLYGSTDHIQNIYSSIRTLRRHGVFIAPVKIRPGEAGILRQIPEKQYYVNQYQEAAGKRILGSMDTQETLLGLTNFPEAIREALKWFVRGAKVIEAANNRQIAATYAIENRTQDTQVDGDITGPVAATQEQGRGISVGDSPIHQEVGTHSTH